MHIDYSKYSSVDVGSTKAGQLHTITYIYIGSQGYTLDALFNDYEWQEHYAEDFKPFGVEEEK